MPRVLRLDAAPVSTTRVRPLDHQHASPSVADAAAAEHHVQFGCGHCAPATWRNFDASPTLRFERLPLVGRLYTKNARRFPANVEYGDILRGLPVALASCVAVFSSHVLQDLTLAQSRVALRQVFAILRPGGVYRMVVPDLAVAVRRYVESDDPLAAYRYLRETKTGSETTVGRRAKVAAALGSRQQWQWDFPSLAHELRDAGFEAVRRCQLGDATDPAFAAVEDPSRFAEALAVEARRPSPSAPSRRTAGPSSSRPESLPLQP